MNKFELIIENINKCKTGIFGLELYTLTSILGGYFFYCDKNGLRRCDKTLNEYLKLEKRETKKSLDILKSGKATEMQKRYVTVEELEYRLKIMKGYLGL